MYHRKKIVVAVVNFGDKSTKGISETLEELGISHIIVAPQEIPFWYTHIILSGGPKHVYASNYYKLPQWVIESKVPVLGICYGMQLIACSLGGNVVKMDTLEYGVKLVTEMIDGMIVTKNRWMNRNDRVCTVPRNFRIIGVTTNNKHIAVITDNKKWWGTQYHPEAEGYRDYKLFMRFLSKTVTDLDDNNIKNNILM
jgi:GMP synthase (glutamine-hydrolysing)